MRALQLLIFAAIASLVLAAQPMAEFTAPAQINASVQVNCPFSVFMMAQPSYTLPSDVAINYALRTLSDCSIPVLNGVFTLYNSSETVTSGNVAGYNVITANSFYVVIVTNTMFSYGSYTANLIFTNMGYTNSSAATFQVLSPIRGNSLTASNSLADQDQYQTLTMALVGGTGPLTYNYIVRNAAGTQVANALYTGFQTSNTFAFQINPSWGTGRFTANVVVTDNSIPSNTAVNGVAFGVNSVFSSASFQPFSQTLSDTQSQILIAGVAGGTSYYNYNFYLYNAMGSLVASQLNDLTSQTSGVIFFYPQSPAWGAGTFTANLIVTDSATGYETVTNTLTYTVTSGSTVSTTVTTTIPNGNSGSGNNGGGGGGGFGGGGIQKPTILNLEDGVLVIGITPPDTFNVTILGVRLDATNNFVGPTSAGVTINDRSYLLTLNGTQNITQDRNPSYIYTLQLYNISWTPVLHTIALLIRAVPSGIPINITSQNTTLEIRTYNNSPTLIHLYGENTILNISTATTAFKIVSVRNLTNSKALPPLPNGYEKLLIQQINMTSAPNQHNVHLNATIGVQVGYNCSLPYYKIIPFVLSNYSWKQVNTFTIDSKSCKVILTFNGDPILATTRFTGASNAVGTTTVQPTLATSTIGATTTAVQTGLGPRINGREVENYVMLALILIIIACVAVMEHRRRAKRSREEKERQKAETVKARGKKRGSGRKRGGRRAAARKKRRARKAKPRRKKGAKRRKRSRKR